MGKEPLSLKHKDELSAILNNIHVKLSEFSFANLFLFREIHKYTVVNENNCLCISGITNDKKEFVLPLCSTTCFNMDHLNYLLNKYHMLFPIAKEWLKHFTDDKYLITHCDFDSDYIYKIDKMATFAGRKLHKKRNLLKQFHKNHNSEILDLTKDLASQAIEVLETWQANSLLDKKSTDYNSCLEAINHFSELKLKGMIYYVDKNPVGFILGEALTTDTFALHFAKGITNYKGIYQFMYNDLAKKIQDKFRYINFEQDLGLQSLRQAKSSYLPDFMENKYRITLKT